jgi:hypothetical protein
MFEEFRLAFRVLEVIGLLLPAQNLNIISCLPVTPNGYNTATVPTPLRVAVIHFHRPDKHFIGPRSGNSTSIFSFPLP